MPHFGQPPMYDPPIQFLTLKVDDFLDLGLSSHVADLMPSVNDPSVARIDNEHSVNADLITFRLTAKKVGSAMLEAKNPSGDVKAYTQVNVVVATTNAPPPAGLPKTKEEFITRLAAEGAAVATEFHVPVCLMIAQACLESGNGGTNPPPGKKVMPPDQRILYGITKRKELSEKKEPDWYPTCQTIFASPTNVNRQVEETDTQGNVVKDAQGKVKMVTKLVKVMDRFCSATSYAQAVRIWAEYVTKHPQSGGIQKLVSKEKTSWTDAEVRQLADHMHTSLGFGVGEKDYGATIMKIIKENDLRKYDAK